MKSSQGHSERGGRGCDQAQRHNENKWKLIILKSLISVTVHVYDTISMTATQLQGYKQQNKTEIKETFGEESNRHKAASLDKS